MLKIDFRPDDGILRRFGFISIIGFGLMALVFHLSLEAATWLTVGLSCLGFLQGIAAGLRLYWLIRPVYLVMSAVGLAIGSILGPLLLGLIYFGVITPFALWFRVIRRDELDRRCRTESESYWRERKGSSNSARYLRLY